LPLRWDEARLNGKNEDRQGGGGVEDRKGLKDACGGERDFQIMSGMDFCFERLV
jgi:hypothetical protein